MADHQNSWVHQLLIPLLCWLKILKLDQRVHIQTSPSQLLMLRELVIDVFIACRIRGQDLTLLAFLRLVQVLKAPCLLERWRSLLAHPTFILVFVTLRVFPKPNCLGEASLPSVATPIWSFPYFSRLTLAALFSSFPEALSLVFSVIP